MPILPWGDYRPDLSDHQATSSRNIANVLPRGDGYGPFADFQAFTSALPAACRGFFYARKTDGSVSIFAGTATKLYNLNNSSFGWADVSLAAGSYPALSATANWSFAQFGNLVVAVQANVPPQVFDVSSSTAFANLGGGPPQAASVAVVGQFLLLSGLLSTPYRIQWSGLNATTTWSPGVNQSDFQDFPDGGIVRGVAGGEFGVIFQDTQIRRMTYAPGSPVVFQIDRIAEDKGVFAPYAVIRAGDRIFFPSPQGFNVLASGGLPAPIGKERVDRTFFADVDIGNLQLMIGSADPNGSRVFWAYKSINGATGLFDKMLCYDWALDRWTTIAVSGQYMSTLAKPGLTEINLDAIQSNLELFPFSFDSISNASFPAVAAFNAANRLGFFNGPNLEATLETAEQSGSGRRIFVRGFRPITDAAAVGGAVSARENLQSPVVFGSETPINAQGVCPQRVSTRYARGRIRIPYGTPWTFATGLEPDIVPEGFR